MKYYSPETLPGADTEFVSTNTTTPVPTIERMRAMTTVVVMIFLIGM